QNLTNLTPRQQIRQIALIVSNLMGGAVEAAALSEFAFKFKITELKMKEETNVLPIGLITSGTFYHRALLFKAICDRIGLSPCQLVRGDYNRAWNIVDIRKQTLTMDRVLHASRRLSPSRNMPVGGLVSVGTDQYSTPAPIPEPSEFPEEATIVDLMFDPGNLLTVSSAKAAAYKSPSAVSGRKHHFPGRVVQEDAAGTFTVRAGDREWAYGVFVCDGHGIAHAPQGEDSVALSGAEQFQLLLVPRLKKTVASIIAEAYACSDISGRGNDDDSAENATDPCVALERLLESLNERLDDEMTDANKHLCKENGSTLSLVLLFRSRVFACNIGDSQIMFFDADNKAGDPLKVWKLKRFADGASPKGSPQKEQSGKNPGSLRKKSPILDGDTHICSYPDSLFLQEGTLQKYITKELALLKERAARAHGGGPLGGYVYSAKSKYRLGMTCSIGNTSHKENLLVRTNVYSFDVATLLELTIAGRLLVVLTSDGVLVFCLSVHMSPKFQYPKSKDVVKSKFIGQTFVHLEKGIRSLSSSKVGNQSSSRRAISMCLKDLIPRATEDAHDRNALSHILRLLELDTSLRDSAEQNCNPPPGDSTLTDMRIATESVCDLAILMGSTDDVTVVAFELTTSAHYTVEEAFPLSEFDGECVNGDSPRDLVWCDESEGWTMVPARRCQSSLDIPSRVPASPSLVVQKIISAVSAYMETKSGREAADDYVAASIEFASIPSPSGLNASATTFGWGLPSENSVGFSFGKYGETAKDESRLPADDVMDSNCTETINDSSPSNASEEMTPTRKRKL
ncbi:Armadillo repeat-containing protein 3, partial [Entophlyctis luteolus]